MHAQRAAARRVADPLRLAVASHRRDASTWTIRPRAMSPATGHRCCDLPSRRGRAGARPGADVHPPVCRPLRCRRRLGPMSSMSSSCRHHLDVVPMSADAGRCTLLTAWYPTECRRVDIPCVSPAPPRASSSITPGVWNKRRTYSTLSPPSITGVNIVAPASKIAPSTPRRAPRSRRRSCVCRRTASGSRRAAGADRP